MSRRTLLRYLALSAVPVFAAACGGDAVPTATPASPSIAPSAAPASAMSSGAPASGAVGTPAASSAAASRPPDSPKPKALNMMWGLTEAPINLVKPGLEAKLGLSITVDILPYTGIQQKTFAELAAGSPFYDLLFIDTPWMPALAGRVEPLGGYLDDPTLHDFWKPDLQDFIPKVFYDTSVYNRSKPHLHFPDPTQPLDAANIARQGFDIMGMPIQSNALVMAYRKDMFDNPAEQSAFQSRFNRALKPPDTWDEFVEVGQFFTRPDKRLYGSTLMAGSGDWATDDFKTLLACWGGDGHLVSDDFKITFNTQEGIDALTFYSDMINKHKITPPGVTSFSWDEVGATFGSGLVSMAMNYGDFSLNPDVTGQIAYTKTPKKLTYGPHFGTWLMALNPAAANKVWAFRTLMGFTGIEGQAAMLGANLHVTRLSAYEKARTDQSLTQKFANYYEILGESLQYGVGRPRLTNYASITEAVWTAVNSAASGRTAPREALASAATRVQELLRQAGYQ